MGTQKKPLLDLNALAPEREVIRIRTDSNPDGKFYELRAQSELSVEQLLTLQRLGERSQELMNLDKLDDAQIELLISYLDELLEVAIYKGYDELRPVLNVMQKAEIARVFTEACLGVDLAVAMAEAQRQAKPKKTRTGAKS